MKPDMILQSDLLDILFENRNKSYGAYVLRKEYSRDLVRSISIVIVLAGVLVMLFFFSGTDKSKVRQIFGAAPDKILTEVVLPKEKVVQPIVKKIRSIANIAPTIVKDQDANEKMPEMKELAKGIISNVTVDGPEDIEDVSSPVPQNGNNGQEKVIVQPAPIDEPTMTPEIKPEFPGGVEGWRRFLSKNLKAPEESGDNNKISVIVKFVVNEDGSLTNLEISKSGGSVFDAEVMRVMKKSPKWIAGSNQGRKVKVFHAQPIIFVYEADQ